VAEYVDVFSRKAGSSALSALSQELEAELSLALFFVD
jgi:hypothetical protein